MLSNAFDKSIHLTNTTPQKPLKRHHKPPHTHNPQPTQHTTHNTQHTTRNTRIFADGQGTRTSFSRQDI
jgi:hypothetical protein